MIVVCIPAFNEEKKIEKVIKLALTYSDKVIVCDDGSTDDTSKIAESSGAFVIKHKKNQGKGSALRSLFNYVLNSEGDIIVTIDGDGQFLPEEIPKLIEPISKNNFDIVIGYRFDSSTQMPFYRKFGNRILDQMTNLASELPFRDTQSGFRSYSRNALKQIKFSTNGFASDSEILINASRKKLRITETKVTVIYQTGEKTSTKNPISHSSEVIVSLVELIALKHPLKFIGIPGIILICFGIVFSIIVLTMFNETRYFSVPYTLVSIGTLIVGVLFLLMSILLFSISLTNRK
jgi:glycosyltransferase involved in cell wall biosynthesis|tara:strand:- start:2750 stop:3622 length:873 start_codon:yes stop_codon:yes gene_type:complete